MSPRPRIPARPTLYKGIQMRSRNEARLVAMDMLDFIGFGIWCRWTVAGNPFVCPFPALHISETMDYTTEAELRQALAIGVCEKADGLGLIDSEPEILDFNWKWAG